MSERLIRLLRTRVAPPAGVTDAELLARWADRRDEAAFELLLRRHAEPVWRTCRAVAGAGAEDAFQATFLALARRAGAVRGNLPGWLWRVARHASLRAKRPVGPAVPDAPTPDVRHSRTYEDFAPLHEELARLPDRYRLPVLLCHLHGLTQAEAAAQLNLPLGTVATRVRRGCDRLRVALTRRGLAPAVGFGPPLVLPAGLVSAALGVGLGAIAAPPTVQLLAKGAVSAMSRTKLKLLAVVAAFGTAVGGGTLVARNPAADPPPKPTPQPAAKWEPKPADYFDRKASMNRLKQVMLAMHNHESAGGKLPRDITGPDGKPLLSWRVAVLPYVGEGFLHTQFKLDEPWDGPTNRRLAAYVPEVFRSPGAGAGMTRVKMFRGPHAALDPAKPLTFTDFTDGTSNTLATADTGAAVEWTRPADLDVTADKPLPDLAGPFTDGYPAGMLDGSVRWLRPNVPEKLLREMTTRDGGEVWQAEEITGPAVAKRPLTDRERKQAAEWRALLERGREYNRLVADQRLAATLAAAKLGPIPLPELPAADDLYALEQAVNNGWQRSGGDAHEFDRLVELVKAKDPATAVRLEKEFNDGLMKLREKQRTESEKK